MGIVFLVDEDMAAVAPILRKIGTHEVHLVTDELAQGVDDSVVCKRADDLGAVIVTRNKNHFLHYLDRRPSTKPRQFRRAGALFVSCARHTVGAARLQLFSELIELEYRLSATGVNARMLVEVCENKVIVLR